MEKEGCVPVVYLVHQQTHILRPVLDCIMVGQTIVLCYMRGTRCAELGCAEEEYGQCRL